MRIKTVILWANGMIMVFNKTGRQMCKWQGAGVEVADKILSAAPDDTVFNIGEWRSGYNEVSRQVFRVATKED